MPIIAIANEKGGVGKSATALSASQYLALNNYRVLLIDFCGQGNATQSILTKGSPTSSYDIIIDGKPFDEVVAPGNVDGLDLLPSNNSLFTLDMMLPTRFPHDANRQLKYLIKDNALADKYDFIIIDSSPMLGMTTINVLTAAEYFITPLEAEKYSIDGLELLLETANQIKKRDNPELEFLGVFVNKYDGRNRLTMDLVEDLKEKLGDKLLRTPVRFNIRIREAAVHNQPLFTYDPRSNGSYDFGLLFEEVLRKLNMPAIRAA